MRLYVVRHAIASPAGTPGIKDEDRPLTEEGIEKMRQIAEGLRSIDYVPSLILSSPLVRARQTAEILLRAFGKGVDIKVSPALAPPGERQGLYREIAVYEKKPGTLMLVGHQPSLGEIVGEIAWGSPEHFVELKKGGVCVVDLESVKGKPKGTMVALLTPSILCRLA